MGFLVLELCFSFETSQEVSSSLKDLPTKPFGDPPKWRVSREQGPPSVPVEIGLSEVRVPAEQLMVDHY